MYQALIRYIYIAIRNAHSDAFHMAIEAIFYLQTSTYARIAYTKVSFNLPFFKSSNIVTTSNQIT